MTPSETAQVLSTWAECFERLKALVLAEQARAIAAEAEVAALKERLRLSQISTHAEGCWEWGPRHYGCAIEEIKRLKERTK